MVRTYPAISLYRLALDCYKLLLKGLLYICHLCLLAHRNYTVFVVNRSLLLFFKACIIVFADIKDFVCWDCEFIASCLLCNLFLCLVLA